MYIDWELLRHQKINFLEVIDHITKGEIVPKIHLDDLTGILHLIDGLQDEAVDVDNEDFHEVFGPKVADTDNDEFVCEDCGEVFDVEDSIKIEGDLYCPDCVKESGSTVRDL